MGKSASPLKRKTFCVRLHSLPAFSANSTFTFIWLVVAQTHVCFCVLGYRHITKEREADFVCVSLCFHYEGEKKPKKHPPCTHERNITAVISLSHALLMVSLEMSLSLASSSIHSQPLAAICFHLELSLTCTMLLLRLKLNYRARLRMHM